MSEYSDNTLTRLSQPLFFEPADGGVADLWITFFATAFFEEFDHFQLRPPFASAQETVARKTGPMLQCALVIPFRTVNHRAK
jgi:hypothetical protein